MLPAKSKQYSIVPWELWSMSITSWSSFLPHKCDVLSLGNWDCNTFVVWIILVYAVRITMCYRHILDFLDLDQQKLIANHLEITNYLDYCHYCRYTCAIPRQTWCAWQEWFLVAQHWPPPLWRPTLMGLDQVWPWYQWFGGGNLGVTHLILVRGRSTSHMKRTVCHCVAMYCTYIFWYIWRGLDCVTTLFGCPYLTNNKFHHKVPHRNLHGH